MNTSAIIMMTLAMGIVIGFNIFFLRKVLSSDIKPTDDGGDTGHIGA